jgi:hypothetical protein
MVLDGKLNRKTGIRIIRDRIRNLSELLGHHL